MKKKFMKVLGFISAIGLAASYDKKHRNKFKREEEYGKKMSAYYHTFNRWLKLKQQNQTLADYFREKGFLSIAIYGYRELGERLYDELKGTDIDIKYIIDKNPEGIFTGLNIYRPDEKLPKVDAIIVTAFYFYDEIEDTLTDLTDYPIISLEDIISQTSE